MPALQSAKIDWLAMSDVICSILITMRDNEVHFVKEAVRRGISLEQCAAASIIAAVRQRLHDSARPLELC